MAAIRRAAGESPDRRWVETEGVVEGLRVVKDPWEQGVLRDAGARLSAVAACILPKVSAGQTERQVAWSIEVALHAAGFERPAFETIVASGPLAARPHHRPTDRRLEKDELVLLDFGGVLDGYSVDLSRTIPLGTDGSGGPAMAGERGHGAGTRRSKPPLRGGCPRRWMPPPGRYSMPPASATTSCTAPATASGLEIHERPTIGPRGDAFGPLQPGMAFTVEPGVYVPGRGGVRIEDDVLVTATGAERLTFDS